MITFESLRKVQQQEKGGKLSKLPDDFFQGVTQYMSELDEDDLEHKNAEKVLDEIIQSRLWKLLKLAYSEATGTKIEKANFTEQDYKTFNSISEIISSHLTKVLNRENSKREQPNILVEFSSDFPQFVGIDGKEYGPFSKGQLAEVPEENAKILVTKGAANKK